MTCRPIVRAIVFSSTTICMVAALFVSGCNNNKGTSNEQTSITEKAGTLRTEQQEEVLDQRKTKSDEFNAFKATLTESDETSEQSTGASGSATISLQDDSIHLKGHFSDLSSAYDKSMIHKVLESEKITSLNPTIQNNQRSGKWEATYQLDENQIEALKADSLYISVYSTDYESSEIRGQIISVDSTDPSAQQP